MDVKSSSPTTHQFAFVSWFQLTTKGSELSSCVWNFKHAPDVAAGSIVSPVALSCAAIAAPLTHKTFMCLVLLSQLSMWNPNIHSVDDDDEDGVEE